MLSERVKSRDASYRDRVEKCCGTCAWRSTLYAGISCTLTNGKSIFYVCDSGVCDEWEKSDAERTSKKQNDDLL
jgi:hypothetical protein